MNQIIKDNEVYELIDNGLFSYYRKTKITEGSPSLTWNKANFSWDMWNDIKNICAYTYEKHKSECLIRLYYHEGVNEWKAMFMPQQMSGMTVSDTLDPQILIDEDCTNGWVEAGSVHHHCAVGASQSGTDEKDEQKQIGIHITLGNIDKDQYGIHSRFKTNEGFSTVKLMSFFDKPEWLNAVPEEYRPELTFNVVSDLVLKPGDPNKAKKEWISRIIEKPKTNKWNGYNTRNNGAYNYTGYNYGGYNYGNQESFDLDTANETTWRHTTTEKELDAEDKYEELYFALAEPEMNSKNECVVAQTTADICKIINISKKEAKKIGETDLWNSVREQINTLKNENKSISLTGFNKYITKNKDALELQLHDLAYDEEQEQRETDKVGKENNTISFI